MVVENHTVICALGIFVSSYSVYVKVRKTKDPAYVAACDFNEHMSCSRVLTSEYSNGFGVARYLFGEKNVMNQPNSIIGIIFYSSMLLLGMVSHPLAVYLRYYMSVLSIIGSIYLAYILFVKLKDFCLVCIGTYVINGFLLYLNYQQYQKLIL